jgi:hypothetical protein
MRFDMNCEANGVELLLNKPNHPWTHGQVERVNRTIKDATASIHPQSDPPDAGTEQLSMIMRVGRA